MIHQIVGSDRLPFWIPDEPNIVTSAIGPGTWWETPLPLFDRVCRPGYWTVEVGAYIGDHTIALAARGPVVAIEPQPLLWALLGLNLALRPRPYPWRTIRTACYSRPVSLELAPGWDEANSPSSAYHVTPDGPVAALPLWALDIPRPLGFLKIDAQGCDLHVLRGARKMIVDDRPIILCEYYKDLAELHGDTARAYTDWFLRHDYALHPYSGDNLLGVPMEIDAAPYLETIR